MLKLLNYSFFYVPYLYLYSTRFKSLLKLVSWFFIYVVPILLLVEIDGRSNLFVFVLYITGLYCVYEVGYIWNDAETIKKEVNPTMRLVYSELSFYEENKLGVYFTRLFISSLIGVYLFEIDESVVFFYLINIFSVLVLYSIYNNIRSVFNLPIHFLLVCSRFLMPVIAFTHFNYDFYLWVLFVFPVLNLLERCAENKFNLIFFKSFYLSNRKRGRYFYYAILLVAAVIFSAPVIVTLVLFYMFLYRMLSFEIIEIIRRGRV